MNTLTAIIINEVIQWTAIAFSLWIAVKNSKYILSLYRSLDQTLDGVLNFKDETIERADQIEKSIDKLKKHEHSYKLVSSARLDDTIIHKWECECCETMTQVQTIDQSTTL